MVLAGPFPLELHAQRAAEQPVVHRDNNRRAEHGNGNHQYVGPCCRSADCLPRRCPGTFIISVPTPTSRRPSARSTVLARSRSARTPKCRDVLDVGQPDTSREVFSSLDGRFTPILLGRTYSWTPSGKIYSSENWANSGTDSFGTYLDITQGPQGVNDNGNFLTSGPYSYAYRRCELLSATPHGLKTRILYRHVLTPQQDL